VTCLDAAPITGPLLARFGGVILASATFGPLHDYAEAIGLEAALPLQEPTPVSKLPLAAEEGLPGSTGRFGALNKRDSKRLLSKITTASELMRVEEEARASAFVAVRAEAPWRESAYRVAVDLRVDTRFEQRDRFLSLTAKTIHQLAGGSNELPARLAVFFPSYAYAEAAMARLAAERLPTKAILQPRGLELSAQADWITRALSSSQALFLVLGSSFAESIDLLGGKLAFAMVVGPALPEVNAIQQARLSALSHKGRELAFRTVFQIPGMQKVNQALGRLVRAPGHQARVLLHCRRFSDPAYARLLSQEYAGASLLRSDEELAAWLDIP
jgi:Rad3-related DNA helicase